MAKLIIRNQAGEDREFPLTDRDLRLGRGEQNDVVLPDPEKAVSRFHADLRYENGTYVLVDANSPNGIWVDGLRVSEVELRPGVEAIVGPYTLTVEDAANLTETVAVVVSAPTMVSTTPQPPKQMDATGAGTAPARTQAPRSGNTELPTSGKTPAPQQTQAPQQKPVKRWTESSKPVWFGAVALLLIVTTVVAVTGFRRRAQRIADEHRRVEEQQQLARKEDEARQREEVARQREEQARQRDEQIRQQLEEAERLFNSRQFNEASNELDHVAEIDPSNAEAGQLREKIQTALNKAVRPGPASSPGPPPSPPPADPRAKALQDRYEQGKQALLNGDYATAVRLLEALLRDDPNTRGDAAFLLEQARMGLRDQTQANARKAETAADLVTALRLYLEAQRIGAANQEDITRVRARMLFDGTEAFNQAKQYYAYSQFEKALPLYQRAYQFLLETDPNRKIAKDRIDAITSRGRGLRGASPNDK